MIFKHFIEFWQNNKLEPVNLPLSLGNIYYKSFKSFEDTADTLVLIKKKIASVKRISLIKLVLIQLPRNLTSFSRRNFSPSRGPLSFGSSHSSVSRVSLAFRSRLCAKNNVWRRRHHRGSLHIILTSLNHTKFPTLMSTFIRAPLFQR